MTGSQGRVALVTGAGSGIGYDLARGLAAHGYRVVLGDVRHAEAAAQRLRDEGFAAGGIAMDVTSDAEVAGAMAFAEAEFGGLDVLVNNAGLFTTIRRAPFEDLSIAEWERVFAVNVTGVFRVAKAALPLLKASGAGRIINITSATVHSAPPNLLHYVSTKGALAAMTRSLARELGDHRITVNAIAPGFTLSTGVLANAGAGLDPQSARARNARAIKRDQEPRDLIGATCFFAGEESEFITGQTLVVDGGVVMH